MAHNLDFLNTHPFLVTFVMGIVLSLEQNKTDTADHPFRTYFGCRPARRHR